MTDSDPSPCDTCPPYKKKLCNSREGTCAKWVKWLFNQKKDKYVQEKLDK